ncbi:MAG: hypothetical protein WBB22_17050 [Anaerolineae bacterium]
MHYTIQLPICPIMSASPLSAEPFFKELEDWEIYTQVRVAVFV